MFDVVGRAGQQRAGRTAKNRGKVVFVVANAVMRRHMPRGGKLPLMLLPVKDGNSCDIIRAIFPDRQREAGGRIDAAAGKDYRFQSVSLLTYIGLD